MFTLLKISMAMLVVSAGAIPAFAGPSHMKTLQRTSQPIGHYRFCEQLPQECNVRTRNIRAPKLTRKRWTDIIEINNYANSTVLPVTDLELYGVEEHWTYPKNEGDCEDYVLLKRYMLMQRGWPASSLLMTVVKQENGDGHAVLTVRTDKADYILDNLETKVKPWYETPYSYIKRVSERHSGYWKDIRDDRKEVASKRKKLRKTGKTRRKKNSS